MRTALWIVAPVLCALSALGGVASCVGDAPVATTDSGTKQPGTVGGPCLPGGQCVAGLVCLSDTCIALPDSGGDTGLADAEAKDVAPEAAACGLPTPSLDKIACTSGKFLCLTTSGEQCATAVGDCMGIYNGGNIMCISAVGCPTNQLCCVAKSATLNVQGTCPSRVTFAFPPAQPGYVTECSTNATCPSSLTVCTKDGDCLSQKCLPAELYPNGSPSGVTFGICK